MTNTALDCRAAAALCLVAVANGSSLSQQLPLYEARVKPRDRSFFRQLCYGTLRSYPRLAACLKPLLSKPLKAKDCDVQMLLLIGLYQLEALRVPDHAAVSATVDASREFKKTWCRGLVNAVLRNWQRRETEIKARLSGSERAAHPPWLHQLLHQSWPDHAAAIEAANNEHPPMCLRVNRQRSGRDAYSARLREAGIAAEPCLHAAEGVRLIEAVDVEQLPGFAAGDVSVQDEAAQLCASLLALAPGQRLLDACCAPGGKTGHCLETEPALGKVVALDIDEQRLQRVRQNLDRLQLKATLLCGDASDVTSWWDGRPFDRILLDAPCSATGVIRRNPDIKLHRQPADIQQLNVLQGELLRALWPTLAPGGLLLYATCSVLPEENEQVIAAFVAGQKDAVHRVINADWGIARAFGRQLFPHIGGHDGFYYALLEKQKINSSGQGKNGLCPIST